MAKDYSEEIYGAADDLINSKEQQSVFMCVGGRLDGSHITISTLVNEFIIDDQVYEQSIKNLGDGLFTSAFVLKGYPGSF
jgi:hypothetical protein